ncbi:putative helicase SWR1 [Amylocarpus encephaloides]|uniref:DNA helicase n=1 Tax=Amylocarpus encephaloides TaxID=45428 RepID=A0A9P8C9P0_9HELO|nr:putative helicase SWR1 [Amylocarpus encephaloides]
MTQTASGALDSQATQQNESQPEDTTNEPSAPPTLPEIAETPKAKSETKHGDVVENEGRPSKKRRVSETAPTPRRKPRSPPWKNAIPEGPSSFTQNGVRKSGRTNHIPFELQPPSGKRQTRGNVQKPPASKSKYGPVKGLYSTKDEPATLANGTRKPSFSNTSANHHGATNPLKVATSPRRVHRKSMPSEAKHTPARHQRQSPIPSTPQSAPSQTHTEKFRRSRRGGVTSHDEGVPHPPLAQDDLVAESPKEKLSRIRFRVKPVALPVTNSLSVCKRPKRCSTLKEFFEVAKGIHVDDGGFYHPDNDPEYTPESVDKDASLLIRLEEAAEPGGLLSPENCLAYEPPPAIRIPDQYAHRDHLNRAAIEFRRLMLIEQRKHRIIAKRLAEACRDEWIRKQPKSPEQLEAEQIKVGENRYKILVKTIQGTWGNVRSEVNRRRLVDWEAQEQDRVRKALNEAVDKSTLKLQAQGAFRDSGLTSDEGQSDTSGGEDEDEEASSASDAKDRESNMSSESEMEEDQAAPDLVEDEGLTQEQLREKYSGLQNLPEEANVSMVDADGPKPGTAIVPEYDSIFDDSDESIDMDDDLGSSDDEPGGEEEETGDEIDGHGSPSLLGFLPASDLKAFGLGQDDLAEVTDTDGVEDTEPELAPLLTNGLREGKDSMDDDEETPQDPIVPSTPTGTLAKSEPRIAISQTPASLKQIHDLAVTSPGHSSQPTPRTTETRPSEVDSASSVELQPQSPQATESSTPQPSNNLKTPIPFLLRGTLREYQHYSLDWLAGLYANHTNGILADEMGLGKTIQTIALLAHLACEHEVWGPHLVIVPTSVILNWEMEFKKWCPGFKVLTYYGTQEERKRKRVGWKAENSWNVCITSYQIILRDQAVFKRRPWHYMILDEAHNIKNFQSQRWQAMLTFNTRARLLLTGTPLQNNLTELWSLLYFLMPSDGTEQGVGGFANLKEFQDWFKKPSEQILEHGREQMDDESRAIISKLHKVLRPYLLRRLKADVEKQMPAKYEHVEYCRLSKRQRELYDSFLSREDTRGTLASGNYLSIINCLMQLRKVCNHPDLFLDRPIMTSFPMEKSAVADFEIKELLVRRRLLKIDAMSSVSLEFLNLVPTKHERFSAATTTRSSALSAQRTLMDLREVQRNRASNAYTQLNPSTANSNLVYLESALRWGRFEELQHCNGIDTIRSNIDTSEKDPFHEARMRLSIQFPDKRLLQYDCGKLQALDKLLRKLQSGGHPDTVIFYDLDWNPAMDKQCQDRCHRIGQTRDVHIYRLVSEHTIEANILRKANQKRMLDDVVIQEGEFTTDYFNKTQVEEVVEEETANLDEDAAAASAAMDRILGGNDNSKNVQRVLAQAEDREDVAAARVAEQEIKETDAADFEENTLTATTTPAAAGTPRDANDIPVGEETPAVDTMDLADEDDLNAWGERVKSTDDYMLHFMTEELKGTPVELPRDKSKKTRDRSHRPHRPR